MTPLIDIKTKILNTNKKSGKEGHRAANRKISHKKVSSYCNTIMSQSTLLMSNMGGETTDCTHNTLSFDVTGPNSTIRNEKCPSVLSLQCKGGYSSQLQSQDTFQSDQVARFVNTGLGLSQQSSAASVMRHERFRKTRPQAYNEL